MAKLTQQDLRIYPSQRLTDTPDGGGLMVGEPLTGADNELFPPVSDLDRTMGSFDARLVYPGVLRNDAEPLYGAHLIISEPPEAQNVSYLAFKAKNYGESRADILPRIEAYSVPTIESRMTLLGRHLAGGRLVQAYQRVEAPLPKVGERYCLEDRKRTRQQFFRIAAVEDEIRTFEIVLPSGQTKEIQRRVLKMEIPNTLNDDFKGVDYPTEGYANAETLILETHVADSASYCGVQPVAEAVAAGSAEIKVAGIFAKLVPTATVETAEADVYPVSAEAWVPSAPRRNVFQTASAASGDIWLESPVLPGSVGIDGWTDNARGQLTRGGDSVQIDYRRGLIQALPDSYGLTVSAIPAAPVNAARFAAFLEIKDSNQGTQFAPLLQPAPVGLSVSFMTLGAWYTLSDAGGGILRDEAGNACGTVSATGSVVLNLPALPDVGSRIVFLWGDKTVFQTYDAKAAGEEPVVKTLGGSAVVPAAGGDFIKPGTLRLAWGGKTATDEAGRLKGGAAGFVDYYGGRCAVSDGLTAAAVEIAYQAYTGQAKEHAVGKQTNGELTLTLGRIAPGSLCLRVAYTARASAQTEGWVQMKYNRLQAGQFAAGGQIVEAKKHDLKIAYDKKEVYGAQEITFTDNGAGGLMCDGKTLPLASVDYGTGKITLPEPDKLGLPVSGTSQDIGSFQILPGASQSAEYGRERVITNVSYQIQAAACRYLADTATRQVRLTETPSNVWANVIAQAGARPVQDTWAFDINGVKLIERAGVLYKNFDPKTGRGEAAGRLNLENGNVQVADASLNLAGLKVTAGVVSTEPKPVYQFCGRVNGAPVKPESFTVYAAGQDGLISARSDAEGKIGGGFTGKIDYQTGFFQIAREQGFMPDSLRYNVVTQDNIPLDSSVIGIDSVRLPADGRVPIFRKGDMVVIGNRLKQDLGSAFTAGQKIPLQRPDADRVCLTDAAGKHVLSELYRIENGAIAFADPLDLSAYTLPLTAVQAWEEENRIARADISGRLKLQFPVSRAYPQEKTYVSSALIAGDLLVRASEPFSQQAWNKKWQDTTEGDDILARLDVRNYPFKLVSGGAVTQRWLILFTSESQFELYGETLGLVAKGDTLTDLAPANPATGKPYFTLPKAAFGGGWATRNCVRFNTYGTPTPVWILRAVQPSPEKQSRRDGFTACLRGNTVADD